MRVLLFFLLCVASCSKKVEPINNGVDRIFDGLYNVEYLESNQVNANSYVWIFSENMIYILYPSSENWINYEEPTHYFVDKDQFYSCGVNSYGKVLLSDCLKEKPNAKFTILGVEENIDFSSNKKSQIITLKSNFGNDVIRLVKNL